MEIVFATNNSNKLLEVNRVFGTRIKIISLAELGYTEPIPEPFETIVENAVHKAQVVHKKFNVNVIAEDTGLEVHALQGRPGVYTGRFAGENATADQNMDKLLEELTDIKDRSAQFRTIASIIYEGQTNVFEGILVGHIQMKKTGSEGFGYDPIFVPEGYPESLAEMGSEEKNKISHRFLAFSKLFDFMESLI